MIAKATVYLAEDRATPVPEGDSKARYLLVREGGDIPQAILDQHPGAAEIAGGTKAAPESADPPAPSHRKKSLSAR